MKRFSLAFLFAIAFLIVIAMMVMKKQSRPLRERDDILMKIRSQVEKKLPHGFDANTFLDVPVLYHPRPRTAPFRSFDLFDTLIFRAGLEPSSIWEDMAAEFGGEAFLKARKRAAMDARGTDITAIYEVVAADLKWNTKRAAEAAEAEMACEFRALHPIVEVVRIVREEDVVVSDMYLSVEFLQRVLLEKCGLRNAVVVTLDGKWQGTVWTSFVPQPSHHFGDDPRADVQSPHGHSIPATLVDVSRLTPKEAAAASSLGRDVALAMRFARLQCPYRGGAPKFLYDAMVEVTFPFLVRTAAAVEAELHAAGRSLAVLCARDCCYLYILMRKLWPQVQTSLLFCSRLTMRFGDAAWDAYFDSMVPDAGAAMLFDMQGTGRSFVEFCNRRGWSPRERTELRFVSSQDMSEFLNIVPFGTCLGVGAFAPCEYPRSIVKPVMEAFSAALRYFEVRATASVAIVDVLRARGCRLPQEPETCPTAIQVIKAFYHCADHPRVDRSSPAEMEHARRFLDLELAQGHRTPAYVICGQKNRQVHVLSMLARLGLFDVRVVKPAPADEATWKEALRMLGVDEKDVHPNAAPSSGVSPKRFRLSHTQASHLVTYIKVLEGATDSPLFLFEDDIVPVLDEDEVALQLQACADVFEQGCSVDGVYFEWCYGHGQPCHTPTSWSDVFFGERPRGGNAYCTAAMLWGSRAQRRSFRDRASEMLKEESALLPFRPYPLATDQLLDSLRIEGSLDLRFYGPLFRQARDIFGSTIEGSTKDVDVVACMESQRLLFPPWAHAEPVLLPSILARVFRQECLLVFAVVVSVIVVLLSLIRLLRQRR